LVEQRGRNPTLPVQSPVLHCPRLMHGQQHGA
jgi:hypothetical protein